MFKKFNNLEFVGIDISANTVRLVKLMKTKNNYRVAAYATCTAATPAAALTQAIAQAQTKIKTAIIAMPYSATIIKTISLDASLQEHEILRYLSHKIEKYTGVSAQNINMDFNVLGKTKDQTNKIDVQLVASKREQIDAKMDLLHQVNIRARVIDIESFALARAATLQAKEDIITVIKFNKPTFLLCVLKNKTPIYTKEENIASQNFTKQLHHELQMFYATHDEIIKQIILAGDIPDPTSLAKNISMQINIPTSLANPFINMTFDDSINQKELYKIAPNMALSCGLALWQHSND